MDIRGILAQRNIPGFVNCPQLSAPIAQHARFCFESVYCIPYPSYSRSEKVARPHHGIAHVSRAASYIPIFANFYRRHHHPDANSLMADDLHLLQIAALFHDAARLNDDKDEWDNESALMCFHYLMKIGCSEEVATKIAEVIANKDYEPGNIYHRLQKDSGPDEFVWQSQINTQPKSILQKLLHDADCLDIIRARPHFAAEYLDLYKDIARDNHLAFEEMALLITQARSLICAAGDQYNENIHELKERYHSPDAYRYIEDDICRSPFRSMLAILYAGNQLLSLDELEKLFFIESTHYDESAPLSNDNLQRALREGKLLFRGVGTPTKELEKGGVKETAAELELRKAHRRLGFATRTTKPDASDKEGNPLRSTSILGFGSGTYTSVGYLVINPDMQGFHLIGEKDVGTGLAKKKHRSAAKLSTVDAQQQLNKLLHTLKMGGISANFGHGWISTHTEALFHIKEFHGVCFTNDPCLYNRHFYSNSYPNTPISPLLQAIYLQQLHLSKTGESVPLMEYSGRDNSVRLIENPTNDELKKLWLDSAKITLDRALFSLSSWLEEYPSGAAPIGKLDFFTVNINLFKAICVYGSGMSLTKIVAPDSLYPPDVRKEIDEEIKNLRDKYMEQASSTLFSAIEKNPLLLLEGYISKLILTKELTPDENAIVCKAIAAIDLDKLLSGSMENAYQCKHMTPDPECNPLENFKKYIEHFNVDQLGRYIAFLLKTNDQQRLSLIKSLVAQWDVNSYKVQSFGHMGPLLRVWNLAWMFHDSELLRKAEEKFIKEKLAETHTQYIWFNVEEVLSLLSEKNKLALKEHWIDILSSPLSLYSASDNTFRYSISHLLKFFPEDNNNPRIIEIILNKCNKDDFKLLLKSLLGGIYAWGSIFLTQELYQFDNIAYLLIDKALDFFQADLTNTIKLFPAYLKCLHSDNEKYIDPFREKINEILKNHYYKSLVECVEQKAWMSPAEVLQIYNYFEITQKLSLTSPPVSLISRCISYLEQQPDLTLEGVDKLKNLREYRSSISDSHYATSPHTIFGAGAAAEAAPPEPQPPKSRR